jgi:hypothetical protein
LTKKLRVCSIALAALFGLSGTSAQEPILLSEGADGILDLDGESRLELEGLRGTLSVRQGKPGEIRFAARDPSDRSVEKNVALWADGATLRLTRLEGAPDEPLRLEVAVSPELDAWVDASDSTLELVGLRGSARVRGERLEILARTLAGSLDVDVQSGSLEITGVTEEMTLEGSDVSARIEHVVGHLTVNVDGGEIALANLRAGLDADVENGSLTIDGVVGRARVRTGGGPVSLSGCQEGAELRLVEAPLELLGTKGAIEIETDAEVRFRQHAGALTIRGRDAAVRGTAASGGPVRIETGGAEVRLEGIEAPVIVRGDAIELHATECKGEMTVETVYSSVVIERPGSPVKVENEFGDVSIVGSSHTVEVVSRDGVVTIEEQSGPVQLRAEGPEASVRFTRLSGSEPSTIENTRGDVRVAVPTAQRCNLDLEAPSGDIETDLEDVQVTDDGHYGSAVLRGGGRPAPYVKRPTIRVFSGGDIYIDGIAGE